MDAITFHDMVNAKIKAEKNAMNVFNIMSTFFKNHRVFVINHCKHKFYLTDFRLDNSHTAYGPNQLAYVSVAFEKPHEYSWLASREHLQFLLGESPVIWKWKFGILKNNL